MDERKHVKLVLRDEEDLKGEAARLRCEEELFHGLPRFYLSMDSDTWYRLADFPDTGYRHSGIE